MRASLCLPLIALAACTTRSGVDPVAVAPTREAVRLAADLEGRTAGAAERCLVMEPTGRLEAIDAGTIVYRRAGAIYVNRLPQACQGLRPYSTLVVQSVGGQYCRGDLVRAVQPGSGIPSAPCLLGDFVPYRRD